MSRRNGCGVRLPEIKNDHLNYVKAYLFCYIYFVVRRPMLCLFTFKCIRIYIYIYRPRWDTYSYSISINVSTSLSQILSRSRWRKSCTVEEIHLRSAPLAKGLGEACAKGEAKACIASAAILSVRLGNTD